MFSRNILLARRHRCRQAASCTQKLEDQRRVSQSRVAGRAGKAGRFWSAALQRSGLILMTSRLSADTVAETLLIDGRVQGAGTWGGAVRCVGPHSSRSPSRLQLLLLPVLPAAAAPLCRRHRRDRRGRGGVAREGGMGGRGHSLSAAAGDRSDAGAPAKGLMLAPLVLVLVLRAVVPMLVLKLIPYNLMSSG